MPALLTATVGNRGARHLRPRLRGLNCPELVTAEGKAAKRCVEGLLPPGTTVTITTTKPDKYDRYLADVFVDRESGEIFAERKLDFQGDRVREGFQMRFIGERSKGRDDQCAPRRLDHTGVTIIDRAVEERPRPG